MLERPNPTGDKLLGYLLRASRRATVSEAILRSIQRLSPRKPTTLEHMAYKHCTPREFDLCKSNTKGGFARPVFLKTRFLKVGLRKLRHMRKVCWNLEGLRAEV